MSERLEDVIDPAKYGVRLVPGYAGEGAEISLGGLVQPAIWLTHVDVALGDPIQVLLVKRPDAPEFAVVVGGAGKSVSGSQPREGTVATAPTGSDLITVSIASGDVPASYVSSYVPVVGDRVRLLWQAGDATILGKVGATPPKPSTPDEQKRPTPPPPPSQVGGVFTFTAADSATYSTGTGSWNSHYGKSVYTGYSSYSGHNRGAWFYHGKLGKIAGRKISKVEVWVPRRDRAGAYNSGVTANMYLHASPRRPGGDVRRGSGTSFTIPKGWRGGWKTLPTSWGSFLVDEADGLGLSGGSYAGFAGIKDDGKSGQIRITLEG